MKNHFFSAILMVLFASILTACSPEHVQTIHFSDEQLENALLEQLDRDKELNQADVQKIDILDLSDAKIENLDGLEAFKQLKSLTLKNNNITDFTVLKQLNNLEYVNVVGNPILDNQEQLAILNKLSKDGKKVVKFKEADGPGGFLWKVQNGKTTVYLQGTIHLGVRDFYPMHEKIEQAYTEADTIVPEVDLNNMDLDESQQLIEQLGTYDDGSTIADHLSEDMYAELSELLDQLALTNAVEHYKPWMISNVIDSMKAQLLDFEHGVDMYFLNRAALDGKEVVPLETAEQQLQIFANLSESYQIDMLQESFSNRKQYKQEMLNLFALYSSGDADKLLDGLLNDSTEETEEDKLFMEELNDKRNVKMADKIASFLNKKDDHTYFVIIGTLHLIHDPSVVTLLEKKGFTVERIH